MGHVWLPVLGGFLRAGLRGMRLLPRFAADLPEVSSPARRAVSSLAVLNRSVSRAERKINLITYETFP